MVKLRLLLNRLTLVFLIVLVSGCSMTGNVTKVTTVVKEDDGGIEAVYFCPRDDCSGKLAEFILEAEKVDCALFDLDLEEVIDALKLKEDVRLVVDEDNFEYVEELDFAKHDNRSSFMYNKFCVSDGEFVITGSTNPTVNGVEKNYNNWIIIIRDKKLTIDRFLKRKFIYSALTEVLLD